MKTYDMALTANRRSMITVAGETELEASRRALEILGYFLRPKKANQRQRLVVEIEDGIINGIYADGPMDFDVLIADYTEGDRMTKDAFGKKRCLRSAVVENRQDLVEAIINKKKERR